MKDKAYTIISETKKTSIREIELENTKVFATTNHTGALSGPLISRFIVVNIPPYSDEEFREIAVKRLTKEEGISTKLATNYRTGDRKAQSKGFARLHQNS